jgi:CRP/FNR family transcriptional regulator, dissimilatory nitrate respiration regulator
MAHISIKTEAFLANLPMFSELGPAELGRIAAATVPLHYDKGRSIVQCGDPCTGFHVVVYGQVKLAFTSPQGVEKVVEIVRPGQSFGEALMFLDKPYLVFAQALADTMVLHVARHAVLEELGPNAFGRRMIAGLAQRLHGLVRDVEAYTLRSGQERIIGYLLAELPEGAPQGAAEVRISAGKSVLASRLNMTPEHFSRILHELAACGLIEVNGRSIRVPDVARLREGSPAS